MIGISVDTLNNYKKLTELVPELQDWVETGILAPTTDREKQSMNMYGCVDIQQMETELPNAKMALGSLLMRLRKNSICPNVTFREPYEQNVI